MTLELKDEKKIIPSAENIDKLERAFLKEPQLPCPVVHRFGPGIYMREVTLPANTFVVGHHHNFEQMNVFLKGRMRILNENGKWIELKAPMTYVGKPGRKVAYIFEECVWMNVFSTNETDVEKLEAQFLTKSEGWVQSEAQRLSQTLLGSDLDHNDFIDALKQFNLTEEQVRKISEDDSDMCDLPFGGYKIKKSKSQIEGHGLFATADIMANEVIAPARINGKRTIAGRFTNHSILPNAKMVQGVGSNIDLVATRNISGCLGGQDGEEITINYREALKLNSELCQGT